MYTTCGRICLLERAWQLQLYLWPPNRNSWGTCLDNCFTMLIGILTLQYNSDRFSSNLVGPSCTWSESKHTFSYVFEKIESRHRIVLSAVVLQADDPSSDLLFFYVCLMCWQMKNHSFYSGKHLVFQWYSPQAYISIKWGAFVCSLHFRIKAEILN